MKWAYTDTRLEEQEIAAGESRREAEAEIARLEKKNQTTIVGFHRNGLPVRINNNSEEENEGETETDDCREEEDEQTGSSGAFPTC